MISITGNGDILGKAIGKRANLERGISWKPKKKCGIVGYWSLCDEKYNCNFVLTQSQITHELYMLDALQPSRFLSMMRHVKPASIEADVTDEWTVGLGCFTTNNKKDLESILEMAVDSYDITQISMDNSNNCTYELGIHYRGTYRELWNRMRLIITVMQGEGCRKVPAGRLQKTLTEIGIYEIDNLCFHKLYSRGKYERNYAASGEFGKFWSRVWYDKLGSLNADKERTCKKDSVVTYTPSISSHEKEVVM
jgi:hypothetical protein